MEGASERAFVFM